ncbi:MAG: AAA family ATPase [Paludibacter sp.]
MKLIEKIEIKHFRSFLGTPNKYETVIENLSDLNIFSGSNDSGKSNILRVLNVFFNNEISQGVPLDFERDFFWGKRNAGHKVIEISVSFDLSNDSKRDKFLPEKFKIIKYFDRSGFRNYLYTFTLKEKSTEIKVDSRLENNKDLSSIFLPENPTEADKKAAEKREWNYRVKFAGFLNKSVSFEYVPAIRDKKFFSQLFGRVITNIKFNEDEKIKILQKEKNKINNWEKTIGNKSERKDFKANLLNREWRITRLNEIEESTKAEGKLVATIIKLEEEINTYSSSLISSIQFLASELKVGKNLKDFFEGFEVGTGSDKSILLSLRGDGVQAKFVPKILDFLSTIDVEKKYFLWGFEEPENSAEYKNQQQLATEFKNVFCKNKQIFITTHSEEFLQLYDGSEVKNSNRIANLYHVKKISDTQYGEYSQVFIFDVDKNEFDFANQKAILDDDLGQSYLRAKYSKELIESEKIFLGQIESIQNENTLLLNTLKLSMKPMVFIEDTYDQLYKIAWLKLNDKNFTEKNIDSVFNTECPFLIFKAEGASSLEGFLRMSNTDFLKQRKIIGLFDFDMTGVDKFKNIKNETYWKVELSGIKSEGFFKKRKDHDCFYALLIPIPQQLENIADLKYPSFVEIENLLPKIFLESNDFVTKEITTGNTEYLKMKEKKKCILWKSTLHLSKDDFSDFVPLFSTINKLFS